MSHMHKKIVKRIIFILCHIKTREKQFSSLTSDTVTFESSAHMFVQNC